MYRIEIIELVADISNLKYPFFYAIGNCVLLYKKRSAKEALLAEKKLVVNDTARARKSPTSGLFVLQGNDFPVI